MFRRVRLDLAYDGTDFAGWQVQPDRPTVQGTLQEALARLHGGERVAVRGAGRTDAGVHAHGQVADALVAESFPAEALRRALDALVPPPIALLAAREVEPGFDARRSALRKTYRYLVDRRAVPDPFRGRFVHRAPFPADLAAIDDALRRLPGRRDWSGFTAASCAIEDRVRTLEEARRVEIAPDVDAYLFTADGFLTHMVRNLVGTLLEIGRGRFEPRRVDAILDGADRTLAGPTAPPHGLALLSVAYTEADGGASGPGGAADPLW